MWEEYGYTESEWNNLSISERLDAIDAKHGAYAFDFANLATLPAYQTGNEGDAIALGVPVSQITPENSNPSLDPVFGGALSNNALSGIGIPTENIIGNSNGNGGITLDAFPDTVIYPTNNPNNPINIEDANTMSVEDTNTMSVEDFQTDIDQWLQANNDYNPQINTWNTNQNLWGSLEDQRLSGGGLTDINNPDAGYSLYQAGGEVYRYNPTNGQYESINTGGYIVNPGDAPTGPGEMPDWRDYEFTQESPTDTLEEANDNSTASDTGGYDPSLTGSEQYNYLNSDGGPSS